MNRKNTGATDRLHKISSSIQYVTTGFLITGRTHSPHSPHTPGYVTMTRRHRNNQWNGGIAAQPAPRNSECKNPLEKFSPRFFGIKTASSSMIIFQKAKLSTPSITHLCWCNWRTFWRKNACRGKVTKGVLFLRVNAPAHRALATQKKLAYLGFQSWSPTLFSRPGPVGLPPVPWTEKTIIRSPFFVRRGGHCCRGDLVGRTTLWIFFFWVACKS